MGASGSVLAIAPSSPLEVHGAGRGTGAGDHHVDAAGVLPLAYRHLSHFPVLAKVARGPVKPRPNDRITRFLKEHSAVVSLVADFLCVKDRLHFLHTHKYRRRENTPHYHRVGLPPKLLKPLFFGGPSRELHFLYCTTISSNNCPKGPGLSKTTTTTAIPSSEPKCLQLDLRYRGSTLSRAVPLRLVASALHRVIRSWLDKKLKLVGRDFDAILVMVNRLLTVFRPTEEVWYAIVNEQAKDGTTLLTYALGHARAPLPMIQQLLEIPCLDLGLPDRARGVNPIQLAHQLGRHDVLTYFASLVSI